MSGLLHQYIVKIIREEKERDPDAFRKSVKKKESREAHVETVVNSGGE